MLSPGSGVVLVRAVARTEKLGGVERGGSASSGEFGRVNCICNRYLSVPKLPHSTTWHGERGNRSRRHDGGSASAR